MTNEVTDFSKSNHTLFKRVSRKFSMDLVHLVFSLQMNKLLFIKHSRRLFIIVLMMVNLRLHHCRVNNTPTTINSISSNTTDMWMDPDFISHERLKRAIKEENREEALKTFLKEWESIHPSSPTSSSSSLSPSPSPSTSSSSSSFSSLTDTAINNHHHIGNSIADHATSIAISSGTDHSELYESIASSDKQSYQPKCNSCVLRETARQRRLHDIQVEILKKLGLKHAPNITHKSIVPSIPPLQQVLKQYTSDDMPFKDDELMMNDPSFSPADSEDYDGDDDSDEDYGVETSKALSFAQKPPSSWTFVKGIKSHYFKFSANVVNSHVSKVLLWTYIKAKNFDASRDVPIINATVVIYEVRRSRNRDSPSLMNVGAEKTTIDAEKGKWITIEVRKPLLEALSRSEHDIGLVIHSYDRLGRLLHVSGPYDDDESQNTFLEISLRTKKSNRGRRETGLVCEEGSKEVNCCLHPLTVDFEEFGWHWVIAPKKYQANFCAGECPYMFLQDNNHATLVQHASPSITRCCSPRKMSSLNMLYHGDNNQIIYGTLKGMKAERCGCS